MDRGLEKFIAPVKARLALNVFLGNLSWVFGFCFCVFKFIEKSFEQSKYFEIQTETIYILMLHCRADCVCCGNSFILCRYSRFSHNSLQMALLPQTISFKSIERAIIVESLWNLGTGGLPDRRHEENAQFQISGFCVRQSDKVPGDIITDTIMGQQELVSAYFSSFVRCYVNRGRCGVFLLLRLYKVDIGA